MKWLQTLSMYSGGNPSALCDHSQEYFDLDDLKDNHDKDDPNDVFALATETIKKLLLDTSRQNEVASKHDYPEPSTPRTR